MCSHNICVVLVLQQLLTENTAALDYSDLATALPMETNQKRSHKRSKALQFLYLSDQ